MVSVVTPSYGRFEMLIRCLRSVRSSRPQPPGGVETIAVTAGYDEAEIRELQALGIRLLTFPEPRPLSTWRNAGAALARGEYLLFLDDDNCIGPNAIATLARGLDQDPGACLVGPVMFHMSAPEQIWCAGIQRTRLLMRTRFRKRLPDPPPARLPTEDMPNCFMVRKRDFELVGGFDEQVFPTHYEDSDLARRLQAATGGEAWCLTEARVWHDIGVGFGERLHLRNEQRAFWTARNRALFTARHGDRAQWLTYLLLGRWVFAAGYFVAALSLRTRRREVIRGYITGLMSTLAGPGRVRWRLGPAAERQHVRQ